MTAAAKFRRSSAPPDIADSRMDGKRPVKVIRNHNRTGISVRPTKYVRKSFGVPGIRNSIKRMKRDFPLVRRNFIESI